jgi:gamma-glutamyltranspeptidase
VINTSKGLRKIIGGGLIFSLVVTVALFIQIIFGGTQVPNRIGIVTAEQVCSDIGADMVRMGGNSVDAFIASSLCLSVVNPFAAGFGAYEKFIIYILLQMNKLKMRIYEFLNA